MHETIVHTAMLLCAVKDRPCSSIKSMSDLTGLLYMVDYGLAIVANDKFKLDGDTLYMH